MKKQEFEFRLVEVLSKQVTVEAIDQDQAIDLVRSLYQNGHFVLDGESDVDDRCILAYDDENTLVREIHF